MNTDKNMNIEDLFTDMERKDEVPARKGRGRRKKSMADLFTELKVHLFDPESGEVQFREVDFDFRGYAEVLKEKSIPVPPWVEERIYF